MPRNKGFSLIELLIVVAIILIIAAMAIPNMLRARIAANEASAANSVRKIATAEVAYSASYPTVGYASDLASLGGPAVSCTPSPATACILDAVVSSGLKSGYVLSAPGIAGGGGTNTDFVAGSSPQTFNVTGIRNFCAVSDGVLRGLTPSSAAPAPVVASDCLAYPSLR